VEQGRLVTTWESLIKNGENEAEIHTLHKYDHTEPVEIPDFISQAPPLRITHSKRQRPTGDFDLHLFYGDTHHPFQNERALDLAQLAIKELNPVGVTFVGDDNDMANFSKFESRQEWANSTQRGIDQFSERLARVRADLGKLATITAFQGNHDFRLERELRKYNGDLLGIKQAGSALGSLTLEFLLRCEELDVEYISGYPLGEKWYTNTLKAYHGKVTNSQGLAVTKELKNETVNIVHGHTHHAGIAYRTFRDGRHDRTIWGMEVGTFADPNKIPSGYYASTERGQVLRQHPNWQTGLGVVAIGQGIEIPSFIPITDEGIMLNGKWYTS
jgi:hypothetical protein